MAVVAAGFVGFEITWRGEIYSGAVQSSSAAKYGTLGVNFAARKARSENQWHAALERFQCAAAQPHRAE
jgi:hypothetical protein